MRSSVLVLIVVTAAAPAQTNFDWNNPSGGSFSTPGNWTPLGPPSTTNHIARFPVASTYSVNFTADVTILRHTVVQGNVTWNLNNFTFQNTDTVNNGVGNNVTPTSLRVINGTFVTGNFSAGTSADVVSTVTFDQGVDVTVGSGVFYIGTTGMGTLTIRNGATVTTTTGQAGMAQNAPGVGSLTVTGAGSALTVPSTYELAGAGNGALTVADGATATFGATNIASSPGGVGVLTVTGAGATFTSNGTTHVGGTSNLFPAAAATINVGPGASVNLNGTTNLRTHATVNVTGGTLNLTGLTIQPGAVVNWSAGKIQFADAATVTGPVLAMLLGGTNTLAANRTLALPTGTFTLDTPLVVNGGTLNTPTFNINAPLTVAAFGTVTSSDIATIGPGQTVQVNDFGSIGATTAILNNGGTLQLNGPAAKVTSFMANNFGIVQGTGRFAGGLNNGTGGFIRARAGDHIIIEQTGLTNPGNMELLGGTIEYTKTLSNLASGFISGRGEFRGGTSVPGSNGLSNIGVVAFSGGTTDVRGDVINSSNGRIVSAGGGVVTFYDDVTHNGAEIRTNAGSRTVFFGGQSGAGPFTGTGVVEYNGDLRPGNSPARVTYDGDVILNPSADFYAELGGLTPGSQYDQLTVLGSVSLGGELQLQFIDGFLPQGGQSFMLVENRGSLPIDGTFTGLPEGSFFTSSGLTFQATYVGGNGNDFVVTPIPEPSGLALAGAVVAGWLLRRRCLRALRASVEP